MKAKGNNLLFTKNVLNKDRRWFEFWKPDFITEYYYLKVKNNHIVLGEKYEA